MKTLGIVCAKADSKRLRGKNTLEVKGKPMTLYAWDAVKESTSYAAMITDIETFLDDKNIKTFYAPQYLRRPGTTLQSIVKWLIRKHHWEDHFDTVVYVLADCPMVKAKDIKKALKIFDERNLNVVRSYDKDGLENGLHIYKMDYFLSHYTDVYCGGIVVPGIEVHTGEDLNKLEKMWK